MIWLIKEDESIAIVSCNVHHKPDKYQLWVERPNGKTKVVYESQEKKDIIDMKEALDWAIENGHKTFSV